MELSPALLLLSSCLLQASIWVLLGCRRCCTNMKSQTAESDGGFCTQAISLSTNHTPSIIPTCRNGTVKIKTSIYAHTHVYARNYDECWEWEVLTRGLFVPCILLLACSFHISASLKVELLFPVEATVLSSGFLQPPWMYTFGFSSQNYLCTPEHTLSVFGLLCISPPPSPPLCLCRNV